MLPRLECGDQVRNASLRLVKQLGQGHSRLLSTTASPDLGDLRMINHVVVAHQDLGLLAELVSQENSTLSGPL